MNKIKTKLYQIKTIESFFDKICYTHSPTLNTIKNQYLQYKQETNDLEIFLLVVEDNIMDMERIIKKYREITNIIITKDNVSQSFQNRQNKKETRK